MAKQSVHALDKLKRWHNAYIQGNLVKFVGWSAMHDLPLALTKTRPIPELNESAARKSRKYSSCTCYWNVCCLNIDVVIVFKRRPPPSFRFFREVT